MNSPARLLAGVAAALFRAWAGAAVKAGNVKLD
jgi:hypothetical protein